MTVGALQPFTPAINAGSVTINAGSTSASVALPPTGDDLLIINAGSVLAFASLTGTATNAGIPLPPNSTTLLSIGPYATALSAITNSGTTTVIANRGNGSIH